MPLVTLSQFRNPKGKRMLLRVDFNVPIGPKGEIDADGDGRIRASAPTIERLSDAGAKVIIVAHLGRPEGRDKKLTLAPIAARLQKIIGRPVRFVTTNLEDDHLAEKELAKMKNGDVTLLENIRFYKGEEANSIFLARRLASFADAYVNDAFAVSHREAASVVGVATLLPAYAGLQTEIEVTHLSQLIDKPKRPMVVLMGGAKISTKLPTLKKLLAVADTVMIGGGMANNFFRAQGYGTGKSLVAADDVALARTLLAKYRKKILLPTEVLVADRIDQRASAHYCRPDQVGAKEHIVDAGAETIRDWAAVIRKAKTIVWNGPLGLFEIPKFSHGSIALGRAIAARSRGKAFGVVGGGETVQCMMRTGMADAVDHISTGGGAMLEFLSGKELPGIKPLMRRAAARAPKRAPKHAAKRVAAHKPAKKKKS